MGEEIIRNIQAEHMKQKRIEINKSKLENCGFYTLKAEFSEIEDFADFCI